MTPPPRPITHVSRPHVTGGRSIQSSITALEPRDLAASPAASTLLNTLYAGAAAATDDDDDDGGGAPDSNEARTVPRYSGATLSSVMMIYLNSVMHEKRREMRCADAAAYRVAALTWMQALAV